jgi:hypothetical protein
MIKNAKSRAESNKQSKAFINKARELGCDEDPKAFERAFSKIVPPKNPKVTKTVASKK